MQLNHDEYQRYAKQILLPQVGESGQLKLKQARVLCIGAGGLGSVVLPYLAAAGIGKIGIIDHDSIELSNLHRQVIYSTTDIGLKKVAAAKKYLHCLNPEIEIEIFTHEFNHDNAQQFMLDYDIAADCTDNLNSAIILNAVCSQLDKPFVFAGISGFQGQCMLFHGKSGPCFSCVFPDIDNSLPDCNSAGVLGVLPGMLGMMQASLILQHILGLTAHTLGRLYVMNLLNMQLRDYQVEKSAYCATCVDGRIPDTSNIHVQSISAAELREKLNHRERFTLLDVRTLQEHEQANLGGVHIPLAELPARLSQLDADIPVIVYCQSGKRSMTAAQLLMKNNFKMAAYLEGGIVSCQPCGMI